MTGLKSCWSPAGRFVVLKNDNLFLIGSRGAGKTTVGKILADHLLWSFVDLDVLLETRLGKTIRQVFEQDGEASFRASESSLLHELSQESAHVVATGGGIVLLEKNRLQLRASGTVIWLAAEPGVLWQRIQADPTTSARRPDLTVGGQKEVEELLHLRAPYYKACAHHTFETGGVPPEEVARCILARLHPEKHLKRAGP
jgi:shikimate kinase